MTTSQSAEALAKQLLPHQSLPAKRSANWSEQRRRKFSLSAERLREIIRYDQETGDITWAVDYNNKRMGRKVGHLRSDGYVYADVLGQRISAHRLAWLYTYGELPPGDLIIDHINGNKSDNRIVNLRTATSGQNSASQRRKGQNQYRGVRYRASTGNHYAYIRENGKCTHLGTFAGAEDAARAYDTAAIRVFGSFAILNFPVERPNG